MPETISARLATDAGLTLTRALLNEAKVAAEPFSMMRNPVTSALRVKGLREIREMEAFLPVAFSICSSLMFMMMPGRRRTMKRIEPAVREMVQSAALPGIFMEEPPCGTFPIVVCEVDS